MGLDVGGSDQLDQETITAMLCAFLHPKQGALRGGRWSAAWIALMLRSVISASKTRRGFGGVASLVARVVLVVGTMCTLDASQFSRDGDSTGGETAGVVRSGSWGMRTCPIRRSDASQSPRRSRGFPGKRFREHQISLEISSNRNILRASNFHLNFRNSWSRARYSRRA